MKQFEIKRFEPVRFEYAKHEPKRHEPKRHEPKRVPNAQYIMGRKPKENWMEKFVRKVKEVL